MGKELLVNPMDEGISEALLKVVKDVDVEEETAWAESVELENLKLRISEAIDIKVEALEVDKEGTQRLRNLTKLSKV